MKARLGFGLPIFILLVACSGVPPAASPTPTSSPDPTGQPSASPSVSPSPSFGGDQIQHPTGADELILQADSVGGFVPPDFIVTQMPYFSLYGDGTVILRPTEDLGGRVGAPGSLPRLIKAQMTEEQVQALLRFALGQGRLLDAREHYPQNSCADCQSAVFYVNAAGVDKTVMVDALGSEMQMDQADRRGFEALAETLSTFEQRALAGELGEVVMYEPSQYLVAIIEATPEQGEPTEWPWSDVAVDDFVGQGETSWRRDAILTSEQVAEVTEVPSGGLMGRIVEDPDGKLWSIALRPLLPHEGEEILQPNR